MENAIEINNVSKEFRQGKKIVRALENINFQIRKGEIFGLLGPNGAGKSTLLNIITNLLTPDNGNVLIFGKDPRIDRSVIENLSFAVGDTSFHWVLKVQDILKFYGISYGIPKLERNKRIKELTDFFGISDMMEKRFDALSTGERMRLVFCKTLLNSPKILLLDEPTLGLDPDIAIKLRKEIKKINKEVETTILLTSHYMLEVEQLCNRIAFINKGRIIDIGKISDVKQKYFSTYELVIEVERILLKNILENLGFKVEGNILKKTMKNSEDFNKYISSLQKNQFRILNIEIKRPSLEDYFIKVLGEKIEA